MRVWFPAVQTPDEQEGIELIRTAADRGAKLIAQLLAFSRQQRLEPREVDLNSKLVGMVNLLSVTLGGTVQLKTTFAPDLWPALIDPNQIEMIVLNLAINAKDAMQPGGTLTLETFNTVIESEPVRPEEPSPGDYVGLAVKDTGTGIPDHVLPLVFEPFFTTKEPGKGSGSDWRKSSVLPNNPVAACVLRRASVRVRQSRSSCRALGSTFLIARRTSLMRATVRRL